MAVQDLTLTPEQIRAAVAAGNALKVRFPSLGSGLNVCQYRALRDVYTVNEETGRRPALGVISLANGCGKTHLLVLDMCGWCLGTDYIDKKKYPPEAVAFYDSVAPIRDKGTLSLRLTCMSDDMRDGGSVLTILKELIPSAAFVAKDQLGTYRQIDIPHPKIDGVVNHIAVKTFDQQPNKHSGSTVHQLWVNEPIPDALVAESVGRIRTKKGAIVPGAIFMTATLLDSCAWVGEFEDDPEIQMVNVRGHIYENCAGEDVTDEMAREVKKTIGVTLEKDPNGKGYITGGVLDKATIDAQCAMWKRRHPHEYEARKCGAPISTGGKVYVNFKPEISVVKNYNVNPKWQVIQVVDPHAAKPSAVIWAQVTPHNRLYIFREYPELNYVAITERPDDAKRETEIWARIEREYTIDGTIKRLGDPNRFLEPQIFFNNMTLRDKFKDFGFDFDIDIVDDVMLGHDEVSDYLSCDPARLAINPEDVYALPRLFIHERCKNTIAALKNYAFKKGSKNGASVTETVNQKYKDFADCVRYLVIWHSKKRPETASSRSGDSDYAKICRSRELSAYRPYSSCSDRRARDYSRPWEPGTSNYKFGVHGFMAGSVRCA